MIVATSLARTLSLKNQLLWLSGATMHYRADLVGIMRRARRPGQAATARIEVEKVAIHPCPVAGKAPRGFPDLIGCNERKDNRDGASG
jgi:hypothetical protein